MSRELEKLAEQLEESMGPSRSEHCIRGRIHFPDITASYKKKSTIKWQMETSNAKKPKPSNFTPEYLEFKVPTEQNDQLKSTVTQQKIERIQQIAGKAVLDYASKDEKPNFGLVKGLQLFSVTYRHVFFFVLKI